MARPSNAREAILESAKDLFWQNSYDSVGVDLICRDAGVNKGSFYHFFPSKEDVALTLLETVHRSSETDLLLPAFADDVGPRERFMRFLGALEKHVEEDCKAAHRPHYPGCPIGNLVLELSTQSERLRAKLEAIIETYIATFTQAIADAKKAGAIAPNADPRIHAELIAAAWQGGILIAKVHNKPGLCITIFRQAVECTFGEEPSPAGPTRR